jgi:hypothetical protein
MLSPSGFFGHFYFHEAQNWDLKVANLRSLKKEMPKNKKPTDLTYDGHNKINFIFLQTVLLINLISFLFFNLI